MAAPAPASQPPSPIPAAHLAVIAATIHEAVRGPHAILGIHQIHEPHPTDPLAWAAEGRRSIFTSHKVR